MVRLAAPSLAADLHRTRLRYLASHGDDRTCFSGAFSNFAKQFLVRRQAEIYPFRASGPNKIDFGEFSHPPCSVTERLSIVYAVDKAVENVTADTPSNNFGKNFLAFLIPPFW